MEVEIVTKDHTPDYLRAVYEVTRAKAPGYLWSEIHAAALARAGGTASQRRRREALIPAEKAGRPAEPSEVQKPFPNEHASRQRPPGDFQADSFRRITLAPHVHAVIGRPEGKTTTEVQSIRFDRDHFTPAQAKAWLKEHDFSAGGFEEATGKAAEIEGRLVKADTDRRLLYFVAMRPDVADTDNEIATGDEVEAAAHHFLMDHGVIKLNHAAHLPAAVVESTIVRKGFDEIGGEKLAEPVMAGDWYVVIKVFSDDLWSQRGEITGISIGGHAVKIRPAA